MFHSRYTIKINKLHERALGSVYDDYNSTLETLTEKDNAFSIPHQNIHCLLVVIYKVVHGWTENEILKNMLKKIRQIIF